MRALQITEPDASQWRLEVGGTFPRMLSRSWATSHGDVESQGGADPWGHTHPWRVAQSMTRISETGMEDPSFTILGLTCRRQQIWVVEGLTQDPSVPLPCVTSAPEPWLQSHFHIEPVTAHLPSQSE